MILFPAIDIQNGKVVRLRQGKFDDVTEYAQDPIEVAREWRAQGAKWIHVVDLDGARTGEVKNLDLILKLTRTIGLPVQMGGGVRNAETMARLLENGVRRVVLGTRVVEDRPFVKDMLERWGERIAVSLDCLEGKVTTKGWTEVTDVQAVDLAAELADEGLRCLIYTDVKRDGMLTGPNFQALEEILSAVEIPVIASGGIASLEDICTLVALEPQGLVGAITGKAIYEGTLDFAEAVLVCSQKG